MDHLLSLPRPPAHAAAPAHQAVARRDAADHGAGRGDRGPAFGAALREAMAPGRSRPTEAGARTGDTTATDAAATDTTATDVAVDEAPVRGQVPSWPATLLAAAMVAEDAEDVAVVLDGLHGLEAEDAAALVAEAEEMLADLTNADLTNADEAVDELAAALPDEQPVEGDAELLDPELAVEVTPDGDQVSEDGAASDEVDLSDTPVAGAPVEDDGEDDLGDGDEAAETEAGDQSDGAEAAEVARGRTADENARGPLRTDGPPRAARADERAAASPRVPGPNPNADHASGADGRGATVQTEGVHSTAAPRGAAERTATLPPGVQRVLDLVSQLEKMPPPRQLILDLGEVKLRVGLEDGQVRLSLLTGDRSDIEEFLAEARAALAERGFDLAGDGEDAESGQEDDATSTDGQRGHAGEASGRRRDDALRL